MAKFSVAVVGASGYGGAEIVRLLAGHPCAEVTTVTSGRSAGRPLREQCPWLATDLVLTEFDPAKIEADFVFLCQEAGFAMEHGRKLIERTRVIDLSADFRLKDASLYPTYYKREHTDPELLAEAVYGLPELVDRERIANARLVANPGCYATGSQLALAPLAKAGLINGIPVIDGKSGVSGAGRSRKETEYLFSELDGGFKAYAVVGHRHTPEIEQGVGHVVRFSPHLVPMPRGLHTTAHVPLTREADLNALFQEAFAAGPFVQVVDAPPSTKLVSGTNRCDIWATYDARTGYAVVCTVIDNLGKGAAGQAIQNLNLMAGLPETTGLPLNGVWP